MIIEARMNAIASWHVMSERSVTFSFFRRTRCPPSSRQLRGNSGLTTSKYLSSYTVRFTMGSFAMQRRGASERNGAMSVHVQPGGHRLMVDCDLFLAVGPVEDFNPDRVAASLSQTAHLR